MMDLFEEILLVLAYSKRTQLALVLGAISFVAVLMFGTYLVDGLQFHGMFSPLTDPVREALLGRYEKAAWGALGGFLMLAIRSYFKDRKRLMSF